MLIGVVLVMVVVLVAAGVGLWAVLRGGGNGDAGGGLDAARSNKIWDQQLGPVVACSLDDPSAKNDDGTVDLKPLYTEALSLCFMQMWLMPVTKTGHMLPIQGYEFHLVTDDKAVDASGSGSRCKGQFAADATYLNCPDGFWLRDTTGQYSAVPLAYAYDLSASMFAFQVLITSEVVKSVTEAMGKAGAGTSEAAGYSRILNAASACVAGVMVKAGVGKGLSETDLTMIRNTSTFGSVSANPATSLDVSPTNYRYWRNYGIDHGSLNDCRAPFDDQTHVT